MVIRNPGVQTAAARPMALLQSLRDRSGQPETSGLSDDVILRFLAVDDRLNQSIEDAATVRDTLATEWSEVIEQPESEATERLQAGILNFYAPDAVNPYVPLAARGPWLVTSHGAVLYDAGGYGMLGLGHAPQMVLDVLSQPVPMANVMTPSISQARLISALQRELGHRRGACPFDQFMCLNSGSEAVTFACRISDINALRQIQSGGPKAGRTVKFLALEEAFHGRTDRPAQLSHSSLNKYQAHLASFHQRDNLIVVPPNDVESLERAFADADASGVFIESMFMEPVMGEGRPGHAATRHFYDAARRLTLDHGSMLIVDSIQAGLRAHGCLSIVDYPGFQECKPPDMETWSKAINAGQFPVSILGMTRRAAEVYECGLYGNTMTASPRACEVAIAVLEAITPELRQNVRDRGAELLAGLQQLQGDFPQVIVDVSGTGLLVSAELAPKRFSVTGDNGVERQCRIRGLGLIHGGKNALRLTPPLNVRPTEVALLLSELRAVVEQLAHVSHSA